MPGGQALPDCVANCLQSDQIVRERGREREKTILIELDLGRAGITFYSFV